MIEVALTFLFQRITHLSLYTFPSIFVLGGKREFSCRPCLLRLCSCSCTPFDKLVSRATTSCISQHSVFYIYFSSTRLLSSLYFLMHIEFASVSYFQKRLSDLLNSFQKHKILFRNICFYWNS